MAGTKTNIPIKTIAITKAEKEPYEGGLRWTAIDNFWFFKIFLWQNGLIKLALDRNVDAIIYLGVMYHLSTWVSIAIAKLTGKRVLMWTHGYLKEERGIKGWLRERFYRLSDGFLLYGNRVKDLMTRRGFDPDTLYVVYNSLNYDLQCAIRKKLTHEMMAEYKSIFVYPNLPTLIFIGRLTSSKKIDKLIEAASLLKKRGTDVNVLILGDGPEIDSLKKYAEQFNMEDTIYFYGACYKEEDIGAFISMSDICVAPGEIGLTCMHSLVYGTPAITHNDPDSQMPEFEAIVPGETGDLFKYEDVQDLSFVIEKWLLNKKSRDEVRKACQSVIDKYYNPHYQIKIINEAVKGIPSSRIVLS
jgi:glycosyltransferase involved in cell wall biosynthesis